MWRIWFLKTFIVSFCPSSVVSPTGKAALSSKYFCIPSLYFCCFCALSLYFYFSRQANGPARGLSCRVCSRGSVRALTSLPGRSSGSLRLQSLPFPRCWSLEVTFPEVFSDVWRPGLERCCRCAGALGAQAPGTLGPGYGWAALLLVPRRSTGFVQVLRLFPKELRCEHALCLSALALLTRTGCFRAACSERVPAEREVPVGSLPGFLGYKIHRALVHVAVFLQAASLSQVHVLCSGHRGFSLDAGVLPATCRIWERLYFSSSCRNRNADLPWETTAPGEDPRAGSSDVAKERFPSLWVFPGEFY